MTNQDKSTQPNANEQALVNAGTPAASPVKTIAIAQENARVGTREPPRRTRPPANGCSSHPSRDNPLWVDVVGGGLAGLTLAIELKLAMGDRVHICVFDQRWTTDATGKVQWADREHGNNRRRQVITLQSNVWSLYSPSVQSRLFVGDNSSEIWPWGPDSPETIGRPRNIRIRWIEDRLLDMAQQLDGIDLRPHRYVVPRDWNGIHLLVIADGTRSPTRQSLNLHFGSPSRELFSLEGHPYDEVVLGLEVCSDLPDEYTIPLTVAQNLDLFNPLQRQGFINKRLTPDEAGEVVGLGATGPTRCIQGSPCVMRPIGKRFVCETHDCVFKPSVDPTSFLWPRIMDTLRYFGVPPHGLLGVTSFTLGMEQHQRFVAEVAPHTFAIVLGDAGPGGFHFWPGRGGNAALKGTFAAVREIVRMSRRRMRLADFTRIEGFLHQLQFREKTRAWTTMLMPSANGKPYLIHERIAVGLRNQAPREELMAKLLGRIDAIKSRVGSRMGSLPDLEWYANRLVGLSNEALAVYVETDQWITGPVGGDEVSVDENFPVAKE